MNTIVNKLQVTGTIFTALLLLNSCTSADDDLGEVTVPDPEYTLPQGGNEEADNRIIEIYNKYNTMVIYDFNPEDAKWSMVSGGGGGSLNSSTITPADHQYLNKQLNLLDTCLFNIYPEAFLKKYLPRKIFLASTIITKYSEDWIFESTDGYTNNSLVYGYGYSKLDSLTTREKYTYFMNVNRDFLLYFKTIINAPEDFTSVSDYTKSIWSNYEMYTDDECRYQYTYKPTEELLQEGFLNTNSGSGMNKTTDIEYDVNSYIIYMIAFPKDSEQWQYFLSFDKVKAKYDALRNYCINTLGFDPTMLGDVNF
jgi:hypothetical protein